MGRNVKHMAHVKIKGARERKRNRLFIELKDIR